jgi:hypothetical protein
MNASVLADEADDEQQDNASLPARVQWMSTVIKSIDQPARGAKHDRSKMCVWDGLASRGSRRAKQPTMRGLRQATDDRVR